MKRIKTIILYFGADASFEALVQIGYRRRNTNLLRALSEISDVAVANVQYAQRTRCFRDILTGTRSASTSPDNIDITITHWIPNRFPKSRAMNAWINRTIIRRQIKHWTTHSAASIVSWCYWPKGYTLWDLGWNRGRMVFDADHNIADDPNLSPDETGRQKVLLKQASSSATLTISSSRSMNRWFEKHTGARTALIMNGVDSHRFPKAKTQDENLNKHRTIGYLGTLSKWIDYDTLHELVKSHPDQTFSFGGKSYKLSEQQHERLNAINEADNTQWREDVHFDDVPEFLKSLDVGLSLYHSHPALDVNSMKIYEYLAAGLPVIAKANHSDLAHDFEDLLIIIEDGTEHGLASAIERGIKLKNDAEWHARRKEFIQRSSWSHRATSVLELVNPKS